MFIPFCHNEEEARYATAAAVTYGCIASPNMRVHDLKEDGPRIVRLFRSSFEMG